MDVERLEALDELYSRQAQKNKHGFLKDHSLAFMSLRRRKRRKRKYIHPI